MSIPSWLMQCLAETATKWTASVEKKSKIYGVDPRKLESCTLVATPGENFDDPARRFQYDPLLQHYPRKSGETAEESRH